MKMQPPLKLALGLADHAGGRDATTRRETNVYPDRLSAREVEVLRLIEAGRSNREIAQTLVLSVYAVENHLARIYAKIGAANRTEAASYAHRHGLAS